MSPICYIFKHCSLRIINTSLVPVEGEIISVCAICLKYRIIIVLMMLFLVNVVETDFSRSNAHEKLHILMLNRALQHTSSEMPRDNKSEPPISHTSCHATGSYRI